MRRMNLKLPLVLLILCYLASPAMGQDLLIDSVQDMKKLNKKPEFDSRDQSTSLMTRPGQPIGLASKFKQLETEFRQKIEEVKTLTILSSEEQEEKIAIIMVREKILAQLLNQTRQEMLEFKTQNRDQSKRIDQLEQKLATFQNTPPVSPALPRANNKEKVKNGASNNDGQIFKASTPPSSCQELGMLDYYLDGLYLVKNKETKKIQTVFCKFSYDNKVHEELIGHMEVKTKNINFYVQRNSSFKEYDAVVTFELERLNEGNAMNLSTGIFTAPVAGIYYFQFSGVNGFRSTSIWIDLEVNGVRVGRAQTNDYTPGKEHINTLSLSSSLRLAANDRVNLFSNHDGILFDGNGHTTHFTGWLVQEDLKY